MKHLFIGIFTLLTFAQCDSVVNPAEELESRGKYPGTQALAQPELSVPANGTTGKKSSPTLDWNQVQGAASYQVQLSGSNDFSTSLVDDHTPKDQYTVNGLPGGKQIYWKVRALDQDSTAGPWSEQWSFTTSSSSGGDAVSTTLTSPEDGTEDQQPGSELRWAQVIDADRYQVQLSTDHGFTNPEKDTVVENNVHAVKGLSAGKTYHWRVRPVLSTANAEWSDTWSFTTATTVKNDGLKSPDSDIWVSAYLASYNHYVPPTGNWGSLPTDEIDWDAFTHLFYFSLRAQADGSLSKIAPYNNMSPDRINDIVSAAHEHDKRVLITIGGWGNYDGFSGAIRPGSRGAFVDNLVSLITDWGFDGIDLDMEPINSGDVDNYINFVRELRSALSEVSTPDGSKPLLTAVTVWHPDLFSQLQDNFDQINVMTYDFAGAWDGWVSWHNSPVYDGDNTFPGQTRKLPSIDGKVQAFLNAGIPAGKLGIGIDFYGYVWSGGNGTPTGGVTEPNQSWLSAPTVADNIAYSEIMDTYYEKDSYRWDEKAEAAYLRIDKAGDSNDKFISYDDEQSVKAKIAYIRQNKLGGAIIWELGGGYRKDQPSGSRDLLLQSVRNEVW